MKHKEKILELRACGKSYREIEKILNCSKSTIAFHCAKGEKEKNRKRVTKRRLKHPFVKKLEDFLSKKTKDIKNKQIPIKTQNLILHKIYTFSRNQNMANFTVQDVIEKFGEYPKCYLTGQLIDINKPRTYHFDHIIPASKGGENTLDNLGICTKQANMSKTDMNLDEYLLHCKMVLENFGYKIEMGNERLELSVATL